MRKIFLISKKASNELLLDALGKIMETDDSLYNIEFDFLSHLPEVSLDWVVLSKEAYESQGLLEMIRDSQPEAKIFIYGADVQESDFSKYRIQGVSENNSSLSVNLHRTIIDDNFAWPEEIISKKLRAAQEKEISLGVVLEKLTKREKEVFELFPKGKTNNDIAQDLCLSTHTVKTHIFNIFKKLNVRSRTEAISLGSS